MILVNVVEEQNLPVLWSASVPLQPIDTKVCRPEGGAGDVHGSLPGPGAQQWGLGTCQVY